MKIDRRAFLALGIGGAAGTALSPLPWKLIDDSSIWTQNWPWTPVPRRGKVTWVDSTCTLCPGACGISVRKVGGRAVKIEGRKGHPVNDGGICILGLAGLQLLYNPTRISGPMKRVGKRGAGQWQPLTWPEAMAELNGHFKAIAATPETLACISGFGPGSVGGLLERFVTAFGSPNYIRETSIIDTYRRLFEQLHGVQALPAFDLANADLVLSFGAGLLDGWGSPVNVFRAHSQLHDRKARLIQVEPRLSHTAAKADQWVAVKPGTESVLALGLCHVIISAGLENRAFIDANTTDFDAFKRMVLEQYKPDAVAQATGIDPVRIIQLGKGFAAAKRPLAVCGRGRGSTPVALSEALAVHALNLLTGSLNREGGLYAHALPAYINWPALPLRASAKRLDGAVNPAFPGTVSAPHRLAQAITTAAQSPVNVLLVAGANPCHDWPDAPAQRAAFEKIPFIVSFSSYMDETAQMADLLLPSPVFLERFEDVTCMAGNFKPVIGLARPVVPPQRNTRNIGDLIIQAARSLGGVMADAFPWKDYGVALKMALGSNWSILYQNGFVADGRLRALGRLSFARLAMPLKTPAPSGDASQYPLTLIPYDSMRLASGPVADPPFVIKSVSDTVLKKNDSFVEINPVTAATYGLKEGQQAVLSTPRGQAKVRVHHFNGIAPDTVALPRGLGHTGLDRYIAGKGVNPNDLIDVTDDPDSGLNAAWGIRAKLTKV